MRKHRSHFTKLQQTSPRRAENVEKSVIWRVCVSIFWTTAAKGKGRRQQGQGRQVCRHSQNVLELWREWTLVDPVSQEEGRPGGILDHSKPSGQSQDTSMGGTIGSYLTLAA